MRGGVEVSRSVRVMEGASIYNPEFVAKAHDNRRVADVRERMQDVATTSIQLARAELERVAGDIISVAAKEAVAIIAAARYDAAEMLARARLEADGDSAPVISVPPVRLRVADIQRAVAASHGIPVDRLIGPGRARRLVEARNEAIALAYRARPDMSLVQLGRAFKRDHTTILHSVRKTGVYIYGRVATRGARP